MSITIALDHRLTVVTNVGVFLQCTHHTTDPHVRFAYLKLVLMLPAVPYFSVLILSKWDIVEPPRQYGFLLWLAILISQVTT